MKTRLLKRLRKEARKEVYIYKTHDKIYPYRIIDEDGLSSEDYTTLAQALIMLPFHRRIYIIRKVKYIRIARENKQLRKL